MGDIYDSYAELKKLCMRNQEELYRQGSDCVQSNH